MRKTLASILAAMALCWAGAALSADVRPAQGFTHLNGKPAAAGPLRAGIPMLYKRYGNRGQSSSWDSERSSTIVVQNTGDLLADVTVCLYQQVFENVSTPNQTWQQCYLISGIAPGASYPLRLDALAEVFAGFAGSALIWTEGFVKAIGSHQFAETNDFLAISVVNAIKPPLANGNAYVPTYYSDQAGNIHAVSALFAQNMDGQDNLVDVKFFPVGESVAARTVHFELAPGRSGVVNADAYFTSFNGSAIVTAKRRDGTVGKTGAHVFELSKGVPGLRSDVAKAYVSFPHGAKTLNMPTALCKAFGSVTAPAQSTAYAIQNVSGDFAAVDVTFEPGHAVASLGIPAHSKASLQTCAVPGIGSNFSGSATITSTADVVAMGKAFAEGQVTGTGTVSAFEGQESGAHMLSIPFVGWSGFIDYNTNNGTRSNIAVQNAGAGVVDGVYARYFTSTGAHADVPLGSINPGAKVNTNPEGLLSNGGKDVFDAIVRDGIGSAQIVGPDGSKLNALVRVQRRRRNETNGPNVAEDYMAEQEEAVFFCTCEIPLPSTPPPFRPYFRERDGKQVTGACTNANTPNWEGIIFDNALHTDATGRSCGDCDENCHHKLEELYNTAIEVHPKHGTEPPDPPALPDLDFLAEDYADMILKKPCQDVFFNYPYKRNKCEQWK